MNEDADDIVHQPNGKAVLGDHLPLNSALHPRWRTWPELDQAAKKLKLGIRQLYRLCEQGKLTRYLAEDGTIRFDPNELKAKAKEQRLLRRDEDEELPEVEAGALTEVTAANLARQAMVHSERLFTLTLAPLQLAHEALATENLALRRQVEKYQERQLEMVEKYEEILSLRHERELQTKRLDAQQQRADALTAQVIEVVGPVVLTKLGHWLGGDEGNERLKAATELLTSVSPSEWTIIKKSGLLKAHQLALLEKALPPETVEQPAVDTANKE